LAGIVLGLMCSGIIIYLFDKENHNTKAKI